MPQPNVRELVVAGPLPGVSLKYKNQSYIGDSVFPIINIGTPKAKITRFLKGAWFRDEAGIRAPGTESRRGGFPVDLVSIAPDEYAYAKEVTDEDVRDSAEAGAPALKPVQNAVEFASDKIDLRKEVIVSNLVKNTTWSDGNAGGEDAEGLWTPSGATNTFFADFRKASEKIRSTTGFKPNRLVIDFGTYSLLKEVDVILDKIKYTQRGVLTKELLAALLELDQILIGEAVVSSAKETKAGAEMTASNIWEKNAGKGMAFLFYAPKELSNETPSAGAQARLAYEGAMMRKITTWREPAKHQDVYEVAENTHILTTGTDLGYLFVDTLKT